MGHRPIPTAPVYEFGREPDGNREPDDGPAYLYTPLQQFIALMRKQDVEDWELFFDERPGLYRALMTNDDLE